MHIQGPDKVFFSSGGSGCIWNSHLLKGANLKAWVYSSHGLWWNMRECRRAFPFRCSVGSSFLWATRVLKWKRFVFAEAPRAKFLSISISCLLRSLQAAKGHKVRSYTWMSSHHSTSLSSIVEALIVFHPFFWNRCSLLSPSSFSVSSHFYLNSILLTYRVISVPGVESYTWIHRGIISDSSLNTTLAAHQKVWSICFESFGGSWLLTIQQCWFLEQASWTSLGMGT